MKKIILAFLLSLFTIPVIAHDVLREANTLTRGTLPSARLSPNYDDLVSSVAAIGASSTTLYNQITSTAVQLSNYITANNASTTTLQTNINGKLNAGENNSGVVFSSMIAAGQVQKTKIASTDTLQGANSIYAATNTWTAAQEFSSISVSGSGVMDLSGSTQTKTGGINVVGTLGLSGGAHLNLDNPISPTNGWDFYNSGNKIYLDAVNSALGWITFGNQGLAMGGGATPMTTLPYKFTSYGNATNDRGIHLENSVGNIYFEIQSSSAMLNVTGNTIIGDVTGASSKLDVVGGSITVRGSGAALGIGGKITSTADGFGFPDGTTQLSAAVSGASSLAVSTGSAVAANQISSPTAVINFSSGAFLVKLTGGATAYISLDFSSITAQGYIAPASGGSSVYPATATASFPFGLSASTFDATSSTFVVGLNQYWILPSTGCSAGQHLSITNVVGNFKYWTCGGDASGGAGGGSDNLGSHVATTTINANYFSLENSTGVHITRSAVGALTIGTQTTPTAFFHIASTPGETAVQVRVSTGGTDLFSINPQSGIFMNPNSSVTIASGQLLIPDGTVGLPGIAFSKDPDNGFYRAGTNDWSLIKGGGTIVNFTSGNTADWGSQISSHRFQSGNLAVPGISFSGASSTGLFNKGVGNQLTYWVSDVGTSKDKMRWDNDGAIVLGSGGKTGANPAAVCITTGTQGTNRPILNVSSSTVKLFEITGSSVTVSTNTYIVNGLFRMSGTGAPTTGGALCFNASNILSKCTTAVDASGNCTCP